MKHTSDEYLTILPCGGLCTEEYADKHKELKCRRTISLNPNQKGYRYVQTLEGKIKMFQYGEHTLFDTEEERDAYREEQAILRAETTRRNRALKILIEDLKSKSTDELELLVANLK